MKKCSATLFFSLLMLTFSCKKENEPTENVFELTFQGQVTNQLTGQPTPDVWIYAVYGPACCGSIESVLGGDSVKTDASGRYKITLKYEPDSTVLIRHMVYPPHSALRFRPLPPFFPQNGWMVYDYTGPYAVPDAITETVTSGMVVENNFQVIPAGIVNASFSPSPIPASDTLSFTVKAANFVPAFNDGLLYSAIYYPTTQLPGINRVSILAGQDNFFTTIVSRPSGMDTIKHTINLQQGQTTDLLISY